MSHTITVPLSNIHIIANPFTRFMTWCESQEENRMLWVGLSLAIHGCILTPITLIAICLAGLATWMIALATASLMLTLVVNLAAVPVKNAIPVFCLSLALNIIVILSAFVHGFNFEGVF